MRKTYKILLIIIFIFLIKLILVNNECYAKTAYIKVLKGTPTALEIGEELEVSVETNESYSNISCSVETKLSDYNKAEIKKSAGKYIISAKSAGTVKLTVTVKYYTRTGVTATEVAELDVNIIDPKQQASEELEDFVNAWENIPPADASADEIRDFIQSAVKHKDETGEDKFSKVTLKTLQSWQKTIEALGMDQIQNYNDEYWKICARIR